MKIVCLTDSHNSFAIEISNTMLSQFCIYDDLPLSAHIAKMASSIQFRFEFHCVFGQSQNPLDLLSLS